MANLLDYSNWVIGPTGNVGSESYSAPNNFWDAYGQNEDENEIKYAPDPWGKITKVWEGSTTGENSSGGGIYSGYVPVDTSYMYRLSVWTRRKAEYGTVYEDDYFGTTTRDGSGEVSIYRLNDGSDRTNPYFDYWYCNENDFDTWILRIGHIFPEGYTITGFHPYDGGWFVDGTKNFNNSYSYAFKSGAGTQYIRLRAFYYESKNHNPDFVQQWVYPRIEKCDGTELSFQHLLNGPYSFCIGASRLVFKVKQWH